MAKIEHNFFTKDKEVQKNSKLIDFNKIPNVGFKLLPVNNGIKFKTQITKCFPWQKLWIEFIKQVNKFKTVFIIDGEKTKSSTTVQQFIRILSEIKQTGYWITNRNILRKQRTLAYPSGSGGIGGKSIGFTFWWPGGRSRGWSRGRGLGSGSGGWLGGGWIRARRGVRGGGVRTTKWRSRWRRTCQRCYVRVIRWGKTK